MSEASKILQLYVKASINRPWRGRRQTLTAPGLELTTLGEVIGGPMPIHALRDGAGKWRKVTALSEYLGAAQETAAHAYLVANERGREVWVIGGQLGLWWQGAGVPVIWAEGGAADLPRRVARELGIEATP